MIKVFIDGNKGTTGLKLKERLSRREDIQLLEIKEELRKDMSAKAEIMAKSDFTFLCLPDDASREAAANAGEDVRIIDASTAHRTESGWAYGLPELGAEFKEKIASSNRVAVPGCHASGFCLIAYPLIKSGILDADYPFSCFSLTGYSGGGKAMIAEYEAETRDREYDFPRQYGLTQNHKHLKEMTKITGVTYSPIFSPIVAPFYSGMEVTVPIFTRLLNGATASDLYEALKNHYEGCQMVKVMPYGYNADKMLSAGGMEKRDDLKLYVYGNEERIIVSAVYDNLGKGASGAAVQCMNIMAGLDETTGLVLGD